MTEAGRKSPDPTGGFWPIVAGRKNQNRPEAVINIFQYYHVDTRTAHREVDVWPEGLGFKRNFIQSISFR